MICKHVLGGRLLHRSLHRSNEQICPRWIICRATISEKKAQMHFDHAKAPAWCVEDDANRHVECYKHECCKRPSGSQDLGLDLLLACRQVHGEAKHIFLSTNTFSFSRGSLLRNFLGVYPLTNIFLPCPIRSHRLAVCSIHIDIRFQYKKDAESWIMAMPQIAQLLPNLRNINISFNQRIVSYNPGGWRNIKLPTARDEAARWEALMESLLSLASLPLRSATFDIHDEYIQGGWSPGFLPVTQLDQTVEKLYRWTLEEKQSRAKAVREAILKPSN